VPRKKTSVHKSAIIKKRGVPLADGIGAGKAWLIKTPRPKGLRKKTTHPRNHALEEGKVRHAIQLLSFVIDNAIQQITRRAGEVHAHIFVALKEVLHDPTVLEQIVKIIRTKNYSAYAAIKEEFEYLEKALGESSLHSMREMVGDLIEIKQGLLDALMNPLSLLQDEEPGEGMEARVIISEHLTPRLVLESRGKSIRGILAKHGGKNSHAAILCRALGIPAVSSVENIVDPQFAHATVALNGATGEIALSMAREDVSEYVKTGETVAESGGRQIAAPEQLQIFANINLSEHALQAIASGANGIGLYRTELEFLAAGKFLTEEEQAIKYRNLVMTMMGLPVVIRLLDVSRDKIQPILDTLDRDIDISLRGADFLEAYPDILIRQATAIARAGNLGTVKVLYPMIRNARQFRILKNIVAGIAKASGAPRLEHGVMFEMPSACNDADELFAEADFGSIGTNDLLMHLFNLSRETAAAEVQEKSQDPLIWEYIAQVARSAQRANKPLTICGEMASQPGFIQRFIDLGIDSISVDFIHVRKLQQLIYGPDGNRRHSR
jgi:phosphotransferase system enzyme I (PtsI)